MAEPIRRRVVYSRAMLKQITLLAQQAKKQHRLAEFTHALAQLQTALELRPLPTVDVPDVFGEPRFRFKHLGLLACTAAPVGINFSVSLAPQKIGDDEFIGVYVTKVELLAPPT